jgi:hypothetical protein
MGVYLFRNKDFFDIPYYPFNFQAVYKVFK